ncbi:ferredoxin [Streptomyces shenzhenensis]|uniref:ferredoxin n=1 Tax=Streptomyces shenzhenensis TaxID=943815 RepID=UPI0015F06DB1|nr:ferredoxin [Streptomyces shenzhenensis]
MNVAVNKDVCIGAGQCALTAPGAFVQDDDGYGTVRDLADPLVPEAARACPVGAISVGDRG